MVLLSLDIDRLRWQVNVHPEGQGMAVRQIGSDANQILFWNFGRHRLFDRLTLACASRPN